MRYTEEDILGIRQSQGLTFVQMDRLLKCTPAAARSIYHDIADRYDAQGLAEDYPKAVGTVLRQYRADLKKIRQTNQQLRVEIQRLRRQLNAYRREE